MYVVLLFQFVRNESKFIILVKFLARGGKGEKEEKKKEAYSMLIQISVFVIET